MGKRYVFEFRDESWFCDEVFASLAAHDAALCLYEMGGRCPPKVLTAGWTYVRLHGPRAAYEGSYSDADLAVWAETCLGWSEEGRDAYVFFDNDQRGYAPRNALRLRELLAERQSVHAA